MVAKQLSVFYRKLIKSFPEVFISGVDLFYTKAKSSEYWQQMKCVFVLHFLNRGQKVPLPILFKEFSNNPVLGLFGLQHQIFEDYTRIVEGQNSYIYLAGKNLLKHLYNVNDNIL